MAVNGSAYMDFKKATDILFDDVSHADLAGALGVSVPSIRQARLEAGAKAKRSPPPKWQAAVAKLASRRRDAGEREEKYMGEELKQ